MRALPSYYLCRDTKTEGGVNQGKGKIRGGRGRARDHLPGVASGFKRGRRISAGPTDGGGGKK